MISLTTTEDCIPPQQKSVTYASWLLTGVDTLEIAADLPDDAGLTTSADTNNHSISNHSLEIPDRLLTIPVKPVTTVVCVRFSTKKQSSRYILLQYSETSVTSQYQT